MSPSHQPTGFLKRVALPVGALLGVVAAAGVTVVALRATTGPDCRGTLPLKIAVAPAAEDVVRRAADEYEAAQPTVDGRCVQVQIEARNAADVAEDLPTAQINPPSLWVPDSSMWASEAQRSASEVGTDAPKLEVKESLATSPLVMAGSEGAMTALGWPVTTVSWQKVVDPSVSVTLSDPTLATEGLATLAVIRGLLGNPDGTPKPELIGALYRVGRTALPSVRDAFSEVEQGAENAPVFTTTEQSVIAANRESGTRRVVASYAQEGTINFDYPLVRVVRQSEALGTGSAAASFEEALRSAQTRQRFTDAGFRDADGNPPQNIAEEHDGVGGGRVTVLPQPEPDQVSELLRTWGAISLDSRMLAVLDVSGSMTDPMPDGETRIAVARDAALTALALLPDTTQIGLWVFSTDKNPPDDWRELVPLGPLGEPLGAVTRRNALQQGAVQLPALVGGGTALNDTALAAFRSMKTGHDPTKVNSVVLITDGKNDDVSSIDTATLIRTLRSESDPAKPVPLIMVGLGPEADMSALQQIATTTGGKAYQALAPEDIQTVLLDAIGQRRCRPNC
ncbi:substrate-binding and VWA domain-containing protein [Umezawaea beigongshangensis]|uniref:substrate-binding and VWA domain-containing protein n=1 Tax=Umezawaea beigongshangensis TaxID=2780383 RepID=UPI0018F109DC|nr:substrate-binding and VWA domain-containing protein [Umezawaea beigongshangensis]